MGVRVGSRFCVPIILAGVSAVALSAQDPGLPPEWEVQKNMSLLVEQTRRLGPLLEEAKPKAWIEKGAPDTYADQLSSTIAEQDYLLGSAEKLAADPERLSLALETYFRLQFLEVMLDSLNEGIRRYQDTALADRIRGVMTDGAVEREKLRQYVLRLASLKEEQFKVMDQEAQRCRALLLRQPPAAKDTEKKAVRK